MTLIYDFNFGPSCASLEAVVTDAYTGVEEDDSPVTLDSAGRAQLPLSEGSYQGVVDTSARRMVIGGVLDVEASLEAAMLAPEAP